MRRAAHINRPLPISVRQDTSFLKTMLTRYLPHNQPSFKSLVKRSLSTLELDDRKAGRARVVVLGSGWAGYSLIRGLSRTEFQPVLISPRPYFVFTPLLASTSVGTLEPRTALESARAVKGGEYWEAAVNGIDFEKKEVTCISSLHNWDPAKAFTVKYDKLVVAVGAHTQTFGIPGVKENAYFLKETADAVKIRKRILHCFEEASLPSTSEERRNQLLHFCIVGGGPTGVEFSAELHDLIHDDLSRLYPSLLPSVTISLYDIAPRILSSFDSALAQYATDHFARQGIEVHTRRTVTAIEDGTLILKEEPPVKFGMLVWSTGMEMVPLVKQIKGAKKDPRAGRIVTDNHLRILKAGDGEPVPIPDAYAIGDCAVIENEELPLTAQVASQKGTWLQKRLNLLAKKGLTGLQKPSKNVETAMVEVPVDAEGTVAPGFKFLNIFSLAYLGSFKAILQRSEGHGLTGRAAWVLWRGAYLTMTISWRNKIRIPILWAINYFFGRDITHL